MPGLFAIIAEHQALVARAAEDAEVTRTARHCVQPVCCKDLLVAICVRAISPRHLGRLSVDDPLYRPRADCGDCAHRDRHPDAIRNGTDPARS